MIEFRENLAERHRECNMGHPFTTRQPATYLKRTPGTVRRPGRDVLVLTNS